MTRAAYCLSRVVLGACALALAGGCTALRPYRSAPPAAIAPEPTQMERRIYQSRVFDTVESEQMLRVIIATLQDLGFVVDQASPALGVVSGSRLGRRNAMRITVTVRSLEGARMLVRANAQTARGPAVDGWRYQEFFAALEKAMFLKAHEVD